MAKKKTNEEFLSEVYNLAGDEYLVLDEYKTAKTKIRFYHRKCGREYSTVPSYFLSGNRCPHCAGNKKKTQEEFESQVFNLGDREYEVLGQYKGDSTKIPIKHNTCGHIYNVAPSNFIQGQRCPKCAGRVLMTIEEVKEWVKANSDCKVLSTSYNSSREKIKIQCDCGQVFQRTLYDFKKSNRCCHKCSNVTIRERTSPNREYIYSVGDKINGYEIVEQTRKYYNNNIYGIKSYTCKCLIDGYIKKDIPEYHLKKGTGCPLCSGREIVRGINDMATTKPENLKYLMDKEDGYKYGKSSNKKVLMVCPDCKRTKMFSINMLDRLGKLPCKCSDGISYPNKFITSLLEQLRIKHTTEKRFKWLSNRYYDFYIEDYSCIIEAHGEQHYIQTNRKDARTLEEELKNDRLKKEKALGNGISNYIVLNCSTSEREFIKNSILNSDLPKLLKFNESDVDWYKCDEFALGNYAKHVCELWDSGKFNTTTELCNYLGVSTNAVNYLKKGNELGWCKYDGQEESRKIAKANAVKNVNNLIKYNKQTGGYWKGKNRSEETKKKIREANLGKKWTTEEKERFIKARTGKTHDTGKRIACGGVVYTSYISCGKAYNISGSAIARYLKGQRKMPQKFIDLGLAYFND